MAHVPDPRRARPARGLQVTPQRQLPTSSTSADREVDRHCARDRYRRITWPQLESAQSTPATASPPRQMSHEAQRERQYAMRLTKRPPQPRLPAPTFSFSSVAARWQPDPSDLAEKY